MPQILSIQYLRAIAAILVVALHSTIAIERHYAEGFPKFAIGEFGVDIFFVISGFIMWTISSAQKTTPAEFLERRIIRIVPLYWALTIPTALISTDQGLHIDLSPDWASVLRSFFFIPEWNEKHDMAAPVLVAGWTLNLEMFFYAIFASALLLRPNARLFVVVSALLALAASRLFIGVSEHPAINLYTNSIVGEFAFGVALGWFYQNGLAVFAARKNAAAVGLLLVVGGAAASGFHEMLTGARIIHFGVPALMIVAGVLLLEQRVARRPLPAIKFLGDASYSIYLAHTMAQAASLKIVGPLFGEASPLLAVLLLTALGCLSGVAVHLLLERPLTKAAGAVARRLKAASAPPLIHAPAP